MNNIIRYLQSGYDWENLEGFKSVGQSLSFLSNELSNVGSGIASVFERNCAKWHKNCRANYNQRMLNRAEKRQHEQTL